jgi:hypothetical protein
VAAVTTDPKGEVHMEQNVQHVGSRLLKTDTSTEFAWYVTGFVDGEGCFSISFSERHKLKTGIEVRPSFAVGQNKRSLPVLERIHTYFGCGAIRFSRHDQTYKYEVRSIGDIRKRIIPHFQKYPLQTFKLQDFAIFVWICDEIAASRHLNKDNLFAIIDRAYTMNESGKRKYTKSELLKMVKAR